MSVNPIIGGNWVTTEPRYRKPFYAPAQGKLGYLTDVELDTLDALSLMGRASSVQDLIELLGFYEESHIRKTLERLHSLSLTIEVEPIASRINLRGKNQRFFRINDRGVDALNFCLEDLIERMEKRGCNGIRRKG